jgi:cell division protein FtsQ
LRRKVTNARGRLGGSSGGIFTKCLPTGRKTGSGRAALISGRERGGRMCGLFAVHAQPGMTLTSPVRDRAPGGYFVWRAGAMIGRRCLNSPLTRLGHARRSAGAADVSRRLLPEPHDRLGNSVQPASRISYFMQICFRIRGLEITRHAGVIASAIFLGASAGYGVVKGGHVPMVVDALTDVRDAIASIAGFGITTVSLSGEKHLDRAAILTASGVGLGGSLLFLDVDAARARLKAVRWIAEATVRKLYPDRVEITVVEREPFALWQLAGRISVISRDGTPIAALSEEGFASLPLVVGPGAGLKAGELLSALERLPGIRSRVRASILVAERRWNLRLENGIDIMLPESGIGTALELLARLDRDKQLLTRDISTVDLRLSDRVSVRLSDEAARAREHGIEKDKTARRKGGDA